MDLRERFSGLAQPSQLTRIINPYRLLSDPEAKDENRDQSRSKK